MKETDFASYGTYQRTFDEAFEDETDAREALVQSPCGAPEVFLAKARYLNAICGSLPLIHDDHGAVAIAVDAFLKEWAA